MGNPNQTIDESPISDPETQTQTETDDAAIQAAVDAAVAKFAAEHGIEGPTPTTTEAPSALQALSDLEHTTFGEKVLELAQKGVQEAALVEESPTVRTLAKIVGEIVEKVA